jgi:alpha-glucosidase
MAPQPAIVLSCAGLAGRVLRFVVGSDELPEPAFLLPPASAWSTDGSVTLTMQGAAFTLEARGTRIVSGSARFEPFSLAVDVGESQVLGFGAATGGPDRNRARFRVMTRDTLFYGIPGSSYTAFPFFVARNGAACVGVLVATSYPLDVEVARGVVSIDSACATDGTPLDVVVFRGSLADIVRDLSTLVGRTFLPPAWALGFHQSRWSYKNELAVLRIARRLRSLDLPADAIHLDIDYMDRYRVFTFNPRRFPDPRRMHDELGVLGLRTMAICDPGVSVAPYPVYQALESGRCLLERADGRPYVGRVWPGATVFPDFAQQCARDAWARFHQPLVDAGVSGIWNDMNDPVLRGGEIYDPLAEDLHHNGVPHRKLRNLYANGMAEATVAGLTGSRPGERPFVLSRSGFLGIQRHAAVWTGDNHSTWEHLRENLNMVLNLGLCGVPLSGADVGGFGSGPGKYGALKLRRPSAELFVRWMELGALMPFFRVHCTRYAPAQEPWSFGAKALDQVRRVLRRRYRFLPLLYRLALESHCDGLPIVRPVFMHFDVPAATCAWQFLLGESVLVAPVVHEGETRRRVWLPDGNWVDYNTGESLAGARHVSVEAQPGATPIFVRAGAAVFLARQGRNAEDTLRGPLALEVTAPSRGPVGGGSLFLDDGCSASGQRFVLDALVEEVSEGLCVRFIRRADTFAPAQTDIELRVPHGYATAAIDGETRQLVRRELIEEDRSAVVMAVRIPLSARTVLLR